MVWRSIRELPSWLQAFVLARFFRNVCASVWLFLAVYLVQERGLDPTQAGLIVGAYGVGILLGSLTGGWFGDRFGAKQVTLWSLLGWALACAVVPIAPILLLLPLNAIGGYVLGVSHPLGVVLMTESLPPEKRRAAVALSRAAMNGGVVLGPPIGALIAAQDFVWVFVLDSLGAVAVAALVWRFVPRTTHHARHGNGGGSLWRAVRADRTIWTLLLAVMLVDIAFRQLYTGLPLTLSSDGGHLLGYGALIAGSCLLIVLAETPIAIKLAHRPALTIIPWGYALIGLGFVVLAIWPRYAGAVAAVAIITVGEMLYKPTSAAYAADRAPEGMNGRYQSLYSAASITGMVLSPPIGGALYQHAPDLLWPVCAAFAFAGTAALIWAARTTRHTPEIPAAATPSSALQPSDRAGVLVTAARRDGSASGSVSAIAGSAPQPPDRAGVLLPAAGSAARRGEDAGGSSEVDFPARPAVRVVGRGMVGSEVERGSGVDERIPRQMRRRYREAGR